MTTRDRHEIEQIRSAYRHLRTLDTDVFPFVAANSRLPADQIAAWQEMTRRDAVKEVRKLLRQYDRCHPDPIAQSLRTGTRRVIWEHSKDEEPDMSDGPTYYWIDSDVSMSDDDCEEIRQDESYRCCSPYDCCGQQFTWSFHWNRTPVGIVFVNRTSYDY